MVVLLATMRPATKQAHQRCNYKNGFFVINLAGYKALNNREHDKYKLFNRQLINSMFMLNTYVQKYTYNYVPLIIILRLFVGYNEEKHIKF